MGPQRPEGRRLTALILSLAAAVLIIGAAVAWLGPDERPGTGSDADQVAEPAPTTTVPAPTVPEAETRPTARPVAELAIPADPWSGDGAAVTATAVRQEGVLDAWAERPVDGADPGAPRWQIPLRNEFGGPLHLLALERQGPWLRVQIPVRPNGTEAWVRADEVMLRPVDARIEISLGERRLRVRQGAAVVLDAEVVIGRSSAPTPLGRFYLRDSFEWDATSVYGAYVLPLSAFSESIEAINGGEAVVAIHGTNRPDKLGQAVSLGCIRLHNDHVTALAQLVPPGSPVTIVA